MRTLRLLIEYDGTDFSGWQVQPNTRTIQDEIEQAVRHMTGARSRVTGASRTDAGVHAVGQVASFTTESSIAAAQIAKGLTALTPEDVTVRAAEEVHESFSARRCALAKTYRYLVLNRSAPSPLLRRSAWHVPARLDLDAMREAAAHLVGRHDFAAFRAADCDRETTERHVDRLEVVELPGRIVEVTVRATAFLKHMVRIIVGTLVDVGKGKLAPAMVGEILASRDRRAAGPTAPARGLCLVEVHY